MSILNSSSSTTEGVVPFYLDHAHVKGRLIRLGPLVETLLARHKYPDLVNHYIAELIALAAALSIDVKHEGIFTLQISAQPDHKGPIRLITVDINTQGHVRAYAQLDSEAFQQTINSSLSLRDIFGQGFMVFTADLAHQSERYQAIVELTGRTLADSMHHFFRQSDQIPTGLILFSRPLAEPTSVRQVQGAYGAQERNVHGVHEHPSTGETQQLSAGGRLCKRSSQSVAPANQLTAGALILQRIPLEIGSTLEQKEQDEDDWITNLSLLGTLTKQELLDKNLSSEQLLHRLFHERKLHVLESKPLQAQCSCSKDRIEKVINNFPPEDRLEMAVNGEIKVVCEFCNTEYVVVA